MSDLRYQDRILAIETATSACSVSLFEGQTVIAESHDVVGRGHAEKLAPMIAELPDRGRAGTILVDCGPGSFTGLRVGLAMALGLGLAWQAPVRGYSSLALMAAMAFANGDADDKVAVTILGGHGEMFVQRFTNHPFAAIAPLASLTPDAALAEIVEPVLVGNAARELVERRGQGSAIDALPRASQTLMLPDSFRTLAARPIYGRAPDAKPQQ